MPPPININNKVLFPWMDWHWGWLAIWFQASKPWMIQTSAVYGIRVTPSNDKGGTNYENLWNHQPMRTTCKKNWMILIFGSWLSVRVFSAFQLPFGTLRSPTWVSFEVVHERFRNRSRKLSKKPLQRRTFALRKLENNMGPSIRQTNSLKRNFPRFGQETPNSSVQFTAACGRTPLSCVRGRNGRQPKIATGAAKTVLSTGKLVGCRYLAVLNAIHDDVTTKGVMSHKLFCIDHLEAFLLMCFWSHKNIQEHHETSAFSSKSNEEQTIFKTRGDLEMNWVNVRHLNIY